MTLQAVNTPRDEATRSSNDERRWQRPRLRLLKGGAQRSSPPHVVAEILSDGTVRHAGGEHARTTQSPSGWRQGSVSGDGWSVWWERRPWSEEGA